MGIKYFFLFILALFAVDTGYGQTKESNLSIKIVNRENGKPLENADVYIQPCDCGGISNRDGVFSIELPQDNYQIAVTYIGFEDNIQRVELNKDLSLELRLNVKSELLSEVIVRAKKVSDNLALPQMGVLRLKTQELRKIPAGLGEYDVLRGMTLLAGVNNAGDVSNGLSIRGGSLDQNLLMYDYAPIFNPTHLFGLFSVFTPEVISSVDLYRANIPARYGGRTTSVLDVKVKNPYVDKLKLTGGIGLVSSRLAVETPIIKDKLTLIAGVRSGFTDFLLPIFSKRLKDTKARYYDGTFKLLYLPTTKDQISLTGFYSKDFYQLDLISKIENINAKNNQYDFKTLNGTLNWLHSFNSKSILRTILVGSTYTPKTIFPEINSSNEIVFKSRIDYLSFLSEFSRKENSHLDYYLGIQVNKNEIDPGVLDPGSGNNVLPVSLETETGYEFSTYANINWKPTEKLSISAGIRHTSFLFQGPYTLNSYNEVGSIIDTRTFAKGEKVVSYNNFEPRLGANLKLGKSTSLKASFAKVNQYIQNIYNSTTPLPTSRWKLSDPNIKPQSSETYGLGFYQNLNNDEIEIGIEGYYRNTNNNLTYKPGADFFLEESLERDVVQGIGKAYGVELSFKKPRGAINGWFNYTWSRSFLRTSNAILSDRVNNNNWFTSDFDRPHIFNGTINFEGDAYNTWSLNFTGQSGRPYAAANGVFVIEDIDVPIFLERNNSRLPIYHRLDFSWKVRYSKKKDKRLIGDWIFTIYNVYGRKNPLNTYYEQRSGDENKNIFRASPLGSFELSILNTPLFSLTYNFVFQ